MKPLFILTSAHSIRNIILGNFEHKDDLCVARKVFTWGYADWPLLRGPAVPAIYIEDRARGYMNAELKGLVKSQEEKGAKVVWLR